MLCHLFWSQENLDLISLCGSRDFSGNPRISLRQVIHRAVYEMFQVIGVVC